MQEWHRKLLVKNKTFPNFPVYIQTEYTKMVKWNRLTTGSVGKGIANKAMEEKILDAKAQSMVIAKVVNVLQAQHAEQMKIMMAMFKKLLASAQAPAEPVVNPPKTSRQPHKECPRCSKKHANHDKCWELDTNKALRLANWKSTKTIA